MLQAKCPMQDPAASSALRDVLFGAWTDEERRHYKHLKELLAEMQG